MSAMKPQASSVHRTHPPRIAGFARPRFAALLAIIIAAVAVWELTRTRDGSVASPPAKSSTARRAHDSWHFRLGQWRADARTLVAAARYLLESDFQTNPAKPEQRCQGLEVAMPTNSTSVGPKA